MVFTKAAYSFVGDKMKYAPNPINDNILEASNIYTKKLAVSRIIQTNIMAKTIDNGIEISIITHVRDKDATFCSTA